MINGVVVQNGDRKARLRIKTGGASILRLKDAIRPDEATTPVKRAYYVAQLAVGGELAADEATRLLEDALTALSQTCRNRVEAEAISGALADLQQGKIYGVMRRLGELFLERRPEDAVQACR